MNNWINKHSQELFTRNDERVEAIPVSALEELFSKDGEQLARETNPYAQSDKSWQEMTQWMMYNQYNKVFLEAYNLQEVKIASLRADLEKANKLFNSIKIPFDVDEMCSNYDRMAEENGQMLVNCANWKRELAAKDTENALLKKEVEELMAFKELVTKRMKSSFMQGINEMLKEINPQP
jgi:hypothetical protein